GTVLYTYTMDHDGHFFKADGYPTPWDPSASAHWSTSSPFIKNYLNISLGGDSGTGTVLDCPSIPQDFSAPSYSGRTNYAYNQMLMYGRGTLQQITHPMTVVMFQDSGDYHTTYH